MAKVPCLSSEAESARGTIDSCADHKPLLARRSGACMAEEATMHTVVAACRRPRQSSLRRLCQPQILRSLPPACRVHGSHQPGDLFFPLQPFNGSTVHVTEG